ncbi:MAG: AMP-binding protein [Bacteroidota bacterium]
MISNFIRIENQEFLFDQLRKGEFNTTQLSEYSKSVLAFCKDWLNGLPELTINTSGSTGKPKLIQLSREDITYSVERTEKALGLKPGFNALCCLNTDFIAGKMMLIRSMEIGMNVIVVPPSGNPYKFLEPSISINFIALVPYQLQAVEEQRMLPMLNQVDCVIIGGAPLTSNQEEIVNQLETRVFQTYGMTETVSHVALKRLSPQKESHFMGLEKISFRVDHEGRLVILDSKSENEFYTNDIVELIDQKRFRWKGRFDNVVNSGGYKIQLESVEKLIEEKLNKLGLPFRSFLFSKPHPQLGEELNLLIESHRLAFSIENKITKSFKEAIPKYAVPKNIFYIKRFIHTNTDKVNRKLTLEKVNMMLNND